MQNKLDGKRTQQIINYFWEKTSFVLTVSRVIKNHAKASMRLPDAKPDMFFLIKSIFLSLNVEINLYSKSQLSGGPTYSFLLYLFVLESS